MVISETKTARAISTKLGRYIYSIAIDHHALTQRSKGQGHTVTKNVTVAQLLVTCTATAMCCCCRRGSACQHDYCFIVFIKSNLKVYCQHYCDTSAPQNPRNWHILVSCHQTDDAAVAQDFVVPRANVHVATPRFNYPLSVKIII